MQWNSFAGSEAICDYKKLIERFNCAQMMNTATYDITHTLVTDTLWGKNNQQ